MKKTLLLLLLSCFILSIPIVAQSTLTADKDSTDVPVRLTYENLIEVRSSNNLILDFSHTQRSPILQRKEVLGVLEISRSFLNNNTSTLFPQDFMPLSVSEYNYSVEQQRLSGQIPFRRSSSFGFLRFN